MWKIKEDKIDLNLKNESKNNAKQKLGVKFNKIKNAQDI